MVTPRWRRITSSRSTVCRPSTSQALARRAVGEDLPLFLQRLQRVPVLVLHQHVDAWVVRLVDGHVVGTEALERLLQREADELRRHVLRQLALAAGSLRVVVEVVAELCP